MSVDGRSTCSRIAWLSVAAFALVTTCEHARAWLALIECESPAPNQVDLSAILTQAAR